MTLSPSLPSGFGASVLVHVGLLAAVARGSGARPAESAPAVESRVEIEVADPLELENSEGPSALAAPTALRSSHLGRHHHRYPVPRDHDATPHDERIVHASPGTALEQEATTALASGPAPLDAAAAPPPRFVLASLGRLAEMTTPRSSAAVVARSPAPSSGSARLGAGMAGAEIGADAGGARVFPEGQVTERARLLSSPAPAYPLAARRSEIEADVPFELVVDAAGRVTSADEVGRFGYGLDEAARAAVARFRFLPARLDGRPVRVRMPWIVQFRLR